MPEKPKAILFWVLLLFAFTIPISQFLGVRLLAIACVLSFFAQNFFVSFPKFFRISWDALAFVIIQVIGLFYTQKLDIGFKVLETSFSILALPIIFGALSRYRSSEFYKILNSFIVGLSIACTICLIYAAFSFFQNESLDSFFFYQFTGILDFQPTYFAYYLCFAISALLYFIHYEKIKYPVWICAILTLFLFAMLMLTAGRTAYISMLFIFSFFILKFLFEEVRSVNTSLTFGLSSVLLIVMLLINYFDLNAGFNPVDGSNDYWERITLWESAIKANPNFLFGVGTGDYKTVLNDYFNTHSLSEYAKSNLNSHNQFIQSYLSNGLLGLVSLFLLLGRPLYLSVKHQNVLGILTFFSFFVYGMTEVFLSRYQGVVFFAFLHQCFISYYYSESNLGLNKT
jgi:O-antigen ligase